MAKQAICDQCGQRGELEEPYSGIPDHWHTLRLGWTVEKHLCSNACLVACVNAMVKPPIDLPEDAPA